MRKFTLLGLIFLLVTAGVFADGHKTLSVTPNATVNAKAELELAWDFDQNDGQGDLVIANTNELEVILNLIDEQTVSEGTGDGVVGFIEISGIKSQLNSDETADFLGTRNPNDAEQARINAQQNTINEQQAIIDRLGASNTPADNAARAAAQDAISAATNVITSIFDQINRDADGDGNLDEDDDRFQLPENNIVSVPKVKARINFAGPLFYIEVAGSGDDNRTEQKFDIDVFEKFSVFDDNDFADDLEKGVELTPDTGETGSLALGTENDAIDFAVVLADEGTEASDLSIGLGFDLKALDNIAGLGFAGELIYNNEDLTDPQHNGGALGPTGARQTGSFAFGVGTDWKLGAIAGMSEALGGNFDVSLGLSYQGILYTGTNLTRTGTDSTGDYFGKLSTQFGLEIFGATLDLFWASDLAEGTAAEHDIRFKASTGSLIEDILKLSFTLDVNLNQQDIRSARTDERATGGELLGWSLDLDLNFIEVDGSRILTPYFNFDYLSDLRAARNILQLKIRTGIKIPAVENITFDVFYENEDIGNNNTGTGQISGLNVNENNGKIGVLTTIEL